jgi:CubicO group peptidase (beta-lactamase class C family)
MWNKEDWVAYVLDLPMIAEPGTVFEYCNSASFLLSAIIQETSGTDTLAYAQVNLFSPLGITEVEWQTNPQGIYTGWGGMRLEPRDMAKIGYLYLQNGVWEGEQIVHAAWVAASTAKYIDATLQDGYGYQWWLTDEGLYMALGYAGQFIFVVPELDLVAVFVSDLPEEEFYTPQQLMESYIIQAVDYGSGFEIIPPLFILHLNPMVGGA